jgi:cysteine desulfurase/selenocysteine lyase
VLNKYRKDFPILEKDNSLSYLDNAATTQKPSSVINRMNEYYVAENANPHRGLYKLSVKATEVYEEGREEVTKFIHARSSKEVIFTRNTTEALNLIAYSYGRMAIKEGDEIVVSILEHHSNILPWQQLAKEKNAVLKYLYLDDDLAISREEIDSKITDKTKIVAISHVSNVLGIINPVEYVIDKAHKVNAVVVLDCAQSIPHFEIDVIKLNADFIAFSGHKMLGPMGIGVLYGKEELLSAMPPFLTGGEMIEYVYEQEATFAPLPLKFEAGTPNVGGVVGLMEAIKYIKSVGYDEIGRIDEDLTSYAIEEMSKLDDIIIYGSKKAKRNGVISFNVKDVHPHDTSSILDGGDVAIRAGHHCAQPLMRYLGVNATCRASFYLYNTKEDVDNLISNLKNVRRYLGIGN